MSQAAMSAGASGFPRLGVCAHANFEVRTRTNTRRWRVSLRVYMPTLAVTIDRPARDRVEMFVREGGYCWTFGHFTAYCNNLGSGWLHITRLIPRAALQHGRPAVPSPRRPKPGECLVEHRYL